MERVDIYFLVTSMIAFVIGMVIIGLNIKNKELGIFLVEHIKIGIEEWFKVTKWVFYLAAIAYIVGNFDFGTENYINLSLFVMISFYLILIYLLLCFLRISNELAAKFEDKYDTIFKIICGIISALLVFLVAMAILYLTPLLGAHSLT
jgi:hypothetical protein